jgi:WD40 repeat protein
MFCNYCGGPNPDDAAFCSACGKPVISRAKAAAPQPLPAAAPPAPPTPTPSAADASLPAEALKPVGPIAAGEPAGTAISYTLTGHSQPIYALRFSPDGRWLVSGSLDKTAKLWDAVEGLERRSFTGPMTFASADFSPDGRWLALAATNGYPFDDAKPATSSLSLWDATRPDEVRGLNGHAGQLCCVRFSRDGRLLASTEGGMVVNLWDVASGRIIKTLKQGMIRSKIYGGAFRSGLVFSPDGRYLATRSWPVTLWDISTGKEVRTFGPDSDALSATVFLDFAPDGQSIVEAKGNGTIRIWDVATGKQLRSLANPPKQSGVVYILRCAALSKDGHQLAVSTYSSVDTKNKVTLWDVGSARPIGALDNANTCEALAFSPDGDRLAIADALFDGGKVVGQIKLQRVADIS